MIEQIVAGILWVICGSFAVGRRLAKTPRPHWLSPGRDAYDIGTAVLFLLGPIGLVGQQFYRMGHAAEVARKELGP